VYRTIKKITPLKTHRIRSTLEEQPLQKKGQFILPMHERTRGGKAKMVFEPRARKTADEPQLEQHVLANEHKEGKTDNERLLSSIPHINTQRLKKPARKELGRVHDEPVYRHVHAEQCTADEPFDIYAHAFLVHADRQMLESERFVIVPVKDDEMHAYVFGDEVVFLGDVRAVFTCVEK
ncbi:hypothetical protein THOM_1239, partial [Trachipleistophora hominis]